MARNGPPSHTSAQGILIVADQWMDWTATTLQPDLVAGFFWGWYRTPAQARDEARNAEFLRRTGLQDVLARNHAEYVNVTEAFWDEDCPGDPAQFVPKTLLDLRGCPMLSYAKFKG